MASLVSFNEPSLLNPCRVLDIALESLHNKFEGPRSNQSKVIHRFLLGSFILQKRRNLETVNIMTPLQAAAKFWYKKNMSSPKIYLLVNQDAFLQDEVIFVGT